MNWTLGPSPSPSLSSMLWPAITNWLHLFQWAPPATRQLTRKGQKISLKPLKRLWWWAIKPELGQWASVKMDMTQEFIERNLLMKSWNDSQAKCADSTHFSFSRLIITIISIITIINCSCQLINCVRLWSVLKIRSCGRAHCLQTRMFHVLLSESLSEKLSIIHVEESSHSRLSQQHLSGEQLPVADGHFNLSNEEIQFSLPIPEIPCFELFLSQHGAPYWMVQTFEGIVPLIMLIVKSLQKEQCGSLKDLDIDIVPCVPDTWYLGTWWWCIKTRYFNNFNDVYGTCEPDNPIINTEKSRSFIHSL